MLSLEVKDFLKASVARCSMIIHCVANVYAVLPVSTVKCLCPEGRNEEGREATPTSISIFVFYDTLKLEVFNFI